MNAETTRWERLESPPALNVPLLGRIEGCTHPESADLLEDGEHVVFGNCAMTLGIASFRQGAALVYLEGEAFISIARITGNEIELVDRERIAELTATLGLDVLPLATALFPKGTVFQAAGGNPIIRRGEENATTDPERRRSHALAYDALTGEVRGQIPFWAGSRIAEKFNEIDQPNGLAIGANGDLFVGDIPNGNPESVLPPPVPSAVYHIPHAALDPLARGEAGSADGVRRVLTPGFVNGVTVSPVDGCCWVVSCSSHDEAEGALYRLTDADFDAGVLPDPAVSGLGVLDGVTFTRRGTVFVSNPRTGEIHAFLADGDHRLILADGAPIARNPADINVCYPRDRNGEPVLLVPDVSVAAGPGEGSVSFLDITGL
jgi:hypothetical protein